jgi:primosomal protein N' (replication factor Y)
MKISVLIPPLEKELAYQVDSSLIKEIAIGSAVYVPIGKRYSYAYVVKRDSSYSKDVRPISAIVGKHPHFLPHQLQFYRWIADYYGYPLSQVFEVAIPKYISPRKREVVKLVTHETTKIKLGAKQRAIYDFLFKQPPHTTLAVVELLARANSNRASLRSLLQKGLVSITGEVLNFDEASLDEQSDNSSQSTKILTPSQEIVFDKLKTEVGFSTSLLLGVTGSGKTEIYLALAQKALKEEKGALILVPEIALTPQMEQRFKERLGERVAILHSAVGARQRWEAWEKLVSGRVKVALGARSAIFAPIHNLSLIVVDEEHDGSFKQSDGLRYNARDLAIVRGKFEAAQVILGSATPSLETYYNARSGKYNLLYLHDKHGSAGKNPVEVIDLSQIKPWFMKSRNISPQLFRAVEATLLKKEQSFILYNRRGFATYMQCDRCSQVVECPNCSVCLTYHLKTNSLICHYCGHREFVSKYCKICKDPQTKGEEIKEAVLVERGSGTEKIFEELVKLFPNAKIDRLDRDVAKNISQLNTILYKVRNKETDILVGTQMIAKGHDLPNVTLSAVVDCDVGINLPDFRAAERTLQLLIQISGRAGRALKSGQVVLQTRQAHHPSINFAATSEFEKFILNELKNRKALNYPPYSRIVRFISSHQDSQTAQTLLEDVRVRILKELQLTPPKDQLLGPAPCAIQKIKGLWRMHLLLKAEKADTISQAISITRLLKSSKVKLVIDRDPYEML